MSWVAPGEGDERARLHDYPPKGLPDAPRWLHGELSLGVAPDGGESFRLKTCWIRVLELGAASHFSFQGEVVRLKLNASRGGKALAV